MNFSPKKITALFCHPDDETLICFGTLAKLINQGAQVSVVFFTDGHQGRLQCSIDTCAWIGARVLVAPGVNATTELNWDRHIIKLVDEFLASEEPDLIITHSPALAEHQEHHHLYRAVLNSVYRASRVKALWLGEPISRNPDFRPNLFIDISEQMPIKEKALAVHNNFLPRWFLQADVVKNRCAFWAMQSPGWQYSQSPGYCEVFQIAYMQG
ncbi:MAG TPA: PIG-L family deacetylase [Anaerolineales bacterium]|nr:PIG-L family deacetylase [Anaerolineales bacterium]